MIYCNGVIKIFDVQILKGLPVLDKISQDLVGTNYFQKNL